MVPRTLMVLSVFILYKAFILQVFYQVTVSIGGTHSLLKFSSVSDSTGDIGLPPEEPSPFSEDLFRTRSLHGEF